MTESAFAVAASLSYGLALVGYGLFTGWVWFASNATSRVRLLLCALAVTALWAGLSLAMVWVPSRGVSVAVGTAELVRYVAWFVFLWHLLVGADKTGLRGKLIRNVVGIAVVILVLGALIRNGLNVGEFVLLQGQRPAYLIRLALTIFGLIQVEQLLRRVPAQMRWGIKPFAIALGGVFAFDLFFYADALLFGALDQEIWIARGVANVLVIPLVAVATARSAGWTVDLHVSRRVVFQSSALLLSGVFLLAIAGAGYFVRYFGGDWGRVLQLELLFAAILAVVLITSSGRFRSKLRVLVSKHFFSYRFDYREEWLRFTQTLSMESANQSLPMRTVAALANLVESPGGLLFMSDDSRGYVVAAAWNVPTSAIVEGFDASLPEFLKKTGWIVDVLEWRSDNSRYAGLSLPGWIETIGPAWLIVPLISGNELLAFALLMTPRTSVSVDWEVRDLLKTASRQAASYLGQAKATDALLEARKFDAFNRMSAFVVHDLKNLVAQLTLMHRNAQRHHDNPAFQADMLTTVSHVVDRMNALMLQLRAGTAPVENASQVELGAVLRRICAAKADPRIAIELHPSSPVLVRGHEDRLEHVIGHLVQNAIDASAAGQRVDISIAREGKFAILKVVDAGAGMTADFMRERLLKPFETTKPSGMGIGVYESQQYLAKVGGELRFESTPGAGTRVEVRLRLAEPLTGNEAQTPLERIA
jgi:putative PEP-CTERM system histidine kinase